MWQEEILVVQDGVATGWPLTVERLSSSIRAHSWVFSDVDRARHSAITFTPGETTPVRLTRKDK